MPRLRYTAVSHMTRRLLNLLTGLSLVLCAAVCVLWVRSYWRFDDFGRIDHRRDAEAYTQSLVRLGSTHGTLLFTWRDVVWPWSNPDSASVADRWQRDQRGWFWKSDPRRPDISRGKPPASRGWEVNVPGFHAYRLDEPAGKGVPGGPEPGMHGHVVKVPHGSVAALLAVPAAAAGVGLWRKRVRKRDGHCPRCGYDLRATPGRCPECGTPPA